MGYQEPLEENVPVGKISLRSALAMIAVYRQDPALNRPEVAAETFKLDPEKTSNLILF